MSLVTRLPIPSSWIDLPHACQSLFLRRDWPRSRQMRRVIGRVINRLLKPTGFRFSRLAAPPETPRPHPSPAASNVSLDAALSRISARGLDVNTVIDVGASDGMWTRVVRQYFPSAFCLLIEANPVHETDLRKFRQELANVDFVLAAAGDVVGEIYFDATDPFSGLASHTPLARPTITVPVTTIDALVAQRQLKAPFLIKLDTHGFEGPILEGARQTLQDTNLLVIEAYNFRLRPGSLKFDELCQLLSTLGFATIDFCDPMFRVRDNAFWQFDLFFIRADRAEFQSNGYF
jgi:FkbM family methyltransferase